MRRQWRGARSVGPGVAKNQGLEFPMKKPNKTRRVVLGDGVAGTDFPVAFVCGLEMNLPRQVIGKHIRVFAEVLE